MRERPSWDEYFMSQAVLAATRSPCLRRQTGAVLVKNKLSFSTGYNGPPPGVPHCDEIGGCQRIKGNLPHGAHQAQCRAIHAEQNAIIHAAVLGVSTTGSSLYTVWSPCTVCVRMIHTAKIRNIFYLFEYPDQAADELIQQSGLHVCNLGDHYPELRKKAESGLFCLQKDQK
jgi:dCMP deaminase